MSLTYRWLGVAGLEFTFQDFTLLIDPFFTRPGMAAVLAGLRVRSNRQLVAEHISRADAVLVTHPHYDHLLDVPEVIRKTGAHAYGSPNTCGLLAMQAIPACQVHGIQVGDQLEIGPFHIEVHPNQHTRFPFSRWLNGDLPPRLLNGPARLPLRLSDYRMDVCYSFRIQAGGLVVQVGKHPVPADALFISPYSSEAALETTLRAVRPKWIVPIHWDDFMRPLSLPLRTMPVTPTQSLRTAGLPLSRLDLQDFTRAVWQIFPDVVVRVPHIFDLSHF